MEAQSSDQAWSPLPRQPVGELLPVVESESGPIFPIRHSTSGTLGRESFLLQWILVCRLLLRARPWQTTDILAGMCLVHSPSSSPSVTSTQDWFYIPPQPIPSLNVSAHLAGPQLLRLNQGIQHINRNDDPASTTQVLGALSPPHPRPSFVFKSADLHRPRGFISPSVYGD